MTGGDVVRGHNNAGNKLSRRTIIVPATGAVCERFRSPLRSEPLGQNPRPSLVFRYGESRRRFEDQPGFEVKTRQRYWSYDARPASP